MRAVFSWRHSGVERKMAQNIMFMYFLMNQKKAASTQNPQQTVIDKKIILSFKNNKYFIYFLFVLIFKTTDCINAFSIPMQI